MSRVAIFGGGVAGLSAAHELVQRGYEVTVHEVQGDIGGKARSQYVPGTAAGARRDLPGEHGFRFYPAFYKHLIRTMEEIPLAASSAGSSRTVASNLRACDEAGLAPADGRGLRKFLRRRPKGPFQVATAIETFFDDLEVDPIDMGRFALRMLQFFVSCDRRRDEEYEPISWWNFLGGPGYTPMFQKYLCAVPRTMVAMDARNASARTIGHISVQLLQDYATTGVNNDRTMIGPTTETWLAPWRAHLERLGVRFHLGERLEALLLDEKTGALTGARVSGRAAPIEAEHHVVAVPLEAAVALVTRPLAAADPELAKLARLALDPADSTRVLCPTPHGGALSPMTDWMVGMQFFLHEDLPMVRGHVFYPDSPWALTSISQAQFWKEAGRVRARYGDGDVGGILSVDISDWNVPGEFVKKPARACSPAELREEVLRQIQKALNTSELRALSDDDIHSHHLCDDIEYAAERPHAPSNRAPLLVHPPGSRALRPVVEEMKIPNLVLASDYVRTTTDLACMEGANEAARRAVNKILDRDASRARRCDLFQTEEPPAFAPLRAMDRAYLDRQKPFPLTRRRKRGPGDPEEPAPMDIESVRRLEEDLVSRASRRR